MQWTGVLNVWEIVRPHAEYERSTSWRHQMETFSALVAICAGNSPTSGEFPAQMPVTRSFGVFFDLCLNKRLRKQSWGWWFKTLSRQLWRHCNDAGRLCEQEYSRVKKIIWIEPAHVVKTLTLETCGSDFKRVPLETNLHIRFMRISCETALVWMPEKIFDEKASLVGYASVPSGHKPSPEPMFTHINLAISRYYTTIG